MSHEGDSSCDPAPVPGHPTPTDHPGSSDPHPSSAGKVVPTCDQNPAPQPNYFYVCSVLPSPVYDSYIWTPTN